MGRSPIPPASPSMPKHHRRHHEHHSPLAIMSMAKWLEVFYDLVFVAAILLFTTAAVHEHGGGVLWIVSVFALAWWIWFETTVAANQFHLVDFFHRLLLLTQMVVIVLMAMEARLSVSKESTYVMGEYAVLLLTVATIGWRASRAKDSAESAYGASMARSNLLGAAGFFVACFLPELGRLALGAVVMVVLVSSSMKRLKALEPFSEDHEEHLVERMAAFTLIVCGETFIKVAITVSHANIGSVNIVSIVVDFFLVLAIFSSYFGDFPTAGLHQRRLGWWTALHLIAQIAIASTAAGITKVVVRSLSDNIPDSEILLLTAPFVVLLLAFAGLDLCTRRRPALRLTAVRLFGALAYAIVGVAAWKIPFIHYVEAIPLLGVVAVVEAIAVGRVEATTTVLHADRLEAGLPAR